MLVEGNMLQLMLRLSTVNSFFGAEKKVFQ